MHKFIRSHVWYDKVLSSLCIKYNAVSGCIYVLPFTLLYNITFRVTYFWCINKYYSLAHQFHMRAQAYQTIYLIFTNILIRSHLKIIMCVIFYFILVYGFYTMLCAQNNHIHVEYLSGGELSKLLWKHCFPIK